MVKVAFAFRPLRGRDGLRVADLAILFSLVAAIAGVASAILGGRM